VDALVYLDALRYEAEVLKECLREAAEGEIQATSSSSSSPSAPSGGASGGAAAGDQLTPRGLGGGSPALGDYLSSLDPNQKLALTEGIEVRIS
jgi:hypothetical protein